MAKSAIIHEVCPIAQGINILSGKWKLQPEIHIMDTQNLLKSKGRTMVFIEK